MAPGVQHPWIYSLGWVAYEVLHTHSQQELARFAPNLEVWVYHGGAKERKALRLEYEQASRRFREHVVDVVLATYSYWEKEACGDDRRFLDKLPIEYLILVRPVLVYVYICIYVSVEGREALA